MSRLLVLGCGYSASRFLDLHGRSFAAVAATARRSEALEQLAGKGVRALHFDATGIGAELAEALGAATHLIVSIPPAPTGDPVLPLIQDRAMPALRWIGYLSTVGVYGDADGGWVDERIPPAPESDRNARRVVAEQGWASLAAQVDATFQSFRIAGIYGPGRNALRNLKDGTAKRIVKPGQVFNRIHVDDIAGALAAGISSTDLTGPVNLADDEPAPPQDVVTFAASLLGVDPPPEATFEAADMTAMARSFYAANKRVSNRRLRQDFGYALRYPTYREGLTALLPLEN